MRAREVGRRLERLPSPAVAAVLLAGVAAVIAACWNTTFDRENVPLPNHRFFDLNAERSLPAAFSAGLLVLAAVAAAAWAQRRRAGPARKAAWFMAALFAFFAVDEFVFVHERLEKALDLDWQVMYLPVAAVGAVAGLVVLRRLPRPGPALLLLGGAGAWLVSQLFEQAQWKGERLLHPWMLFPEEALEMVGSILFALAFLTALQRAEAPDRDGPGASSLASG